MDKLTVLVVDDEYINVEIICEILGERYNLVVANDGKRGYEAYLKCKPSIVISDIVMPEIDGLEMAKKIREDDINTKIIFLTSHSDVSYLLKSTSLKLTKYILKPIDKNELIKAVELAELELDKFKVVHKDILHIDDEFTWNFKNLELLKNGELIALTPKERKILNYLFENEEQTKTYDDILYEVWDDFEMPTKQALKTMMTNLRKKVPENLIHNIYGIGYKILTTS